MFLSIAAAHGCRVILFMDDEDDSSQDDTEFDLVFPMKRESLQQQLIKLCVRFFL